MKGAQRKTTVTSVTSVGERYRLELIALPSSTPAIIRLRAALKLFLRVSPTLCQHR